MANFAKSMNGSNFYSEVETSPFYEDAKLAYTFKGNFSEAESAAGREAKYLAVWFYSYLHEDADSLLAEVLKADEVAVQFLERCVVYLACVETREGSSLAKKYDVDTYPSLIVFFRNEVALELGGRLTKEIVLEELKKCMDTWDFIVAEELVFVTEREERLMELEREKKRDQHLEEEDLKRLRAYEEEKEEKERQQEEQRRLKQQRQKEQASLALELEKHQQSVRERESRLISTREEALRLLHPERAVNSNCATAEEKNNGKGMEEMSLVSLRFRFNSGEVRNRTFLRDDLADQLLYYVQSVDDACCVGTVELSAGYPPRLLKWEAKISTIKSLKQLSTNTVVNVRVT